MNKDKEPLMSAYKWYLKTKKRDRGFTTYEWMEAYAKYHTEWHLNNVKEVVCDEAKVGLEQHGMVIFQVVEKQSITKAVDNYIKYRLLKK